MTRHIWAAIGDSVTEGQGASARVNRWLERAAALVRTHDSLAAGGRGFVPVHYGVTSPDSPWGYDDVTASSGNWAVEDNDGFGYRSIGLYPTSGSGAGSVTWTLHGTSVDIWYVKKSGGGTFSYKVNGGGATNISTSAGSTSYGFTHVALGTSGTYTLQLTEVSNNAVILGFTVYDGDESGSAVITYDAAYTGIDTPMYTGGTGAPYSTLSAALRGLTPSVLLLCLGVNDYNTVSATPAQTQTNLETIIGDWVGMLVPGGYPGSYPGAGPLQIVVINLPRIGDEFPVPGGQTHTWDEYRSAVAAAAATYSVDLLDLDDYMPPLATQCVYYNGAGELSDTGHDYVATVVADYLTSTTIPLGVAKVVDDFEHLTLDTTTLWAGTYGTAGMGGRVFVQCSTGYSGLSTAADYCLTGSGFRAKVTPAPVAGASATAYSRLVMRAPTAGTDIGFEIDTYSGNLLCYSRVSYTDGSQVSLSYSATNHKYLRLREFSGTVYWDTSADGGTWTNRRSASAPGWVSNSDNDLTFECHRNSGTTNYGVIELVGTAG